MPTIFKSIKKRMKRKMTLMLQTTREITMMKISTGRRKHLTLSISAMGIPIRRLSTLKMSMGNIQVLLSQWMTF